MFFLRITFFIIVMLGFLVYLISTKIRLEFLNTGGKAQPLFRGHSAEFKDFCKNPPTQYVLRVLEIKRKLSVALSIAIISFLLAILSVAL